MGSFSRNPNSTRKFIATRALGNRDVRQSDHHDLVLVHLETLGVLDTLHPSPPRIYLTSVRRAIAFKQADATAATNVLFALGSTRLVVLVAALLILPLLLRLAALLHLGRNTELSAMDRNDWIVSLALPVFGFGAGIAYCARFRRVWAIVGLVWIVVIAIALKIMTVNVTQALIPEGDELRMEFRLKRAKRPRRRPRQQEVPHHHQQRLQ